MFPGLGLLVMLSDCFSTISCTELYVRGRKLSQANDANNLTNI